MPYELAKTTPAPGEAFVANCLAANTHPIESVYNHDGTTLTPPSTCTKFKTAHPERMITKLVGGFDPLQLAADFSPRREAAGETAQEVL